MCISIQVFKYLEAQCKWVDTCTKGNANTGWNKKGEIIYTLLSKFSVVDYLKLLHSGPWHFLFVKVFEN